MIKKEVESIFKEHNPNYKTWDVHTRRFLWDMFTDALCKNGDITQKQFSNWMRPNFIENGR
jgi:hypothetical protein